MDVAVCNFDEPGRAVRFSYFDPSGDVRGNGPALLSELGFGRPASALGGFALQYDGDDGLDVATMIICINEDPTPQSVAVQLVDAAGNHSNVGCLFPN